MNTRLQVEHPVTEEVTGLDLVRMQLHVASGEKLSLKQEDVRQRGHSIEVRIYAEDVRGGFLPSTGTLRRLRPPVGPGIREDSGLREGSDVSRFYDPMISKLVVKAETRAAAIERMLRALADYRVSGVRTTIPLCRSILQSREFAAGNFHTGSVEALFAERFTDEESIELENERVLAAALALGLSNQKGSSKAQHNGYHNLKATIWKQRGRESAMQFPQRKS
jgi:acetyl/propionyl-CoA carboxylase alpha subunit